MNKGLVVAAALLVGACDTHDRSFRIPTTPTATQATPATPAPPAAPPRFDPNIEVTSIAVGEVVNRTIGDSPPECVDFRGWPCQYFQLTAPRSGTLVVELTYVPDTQPSGRTRYQGVDISLLGGTFGERWAEFGNETTTRLTARVTGDTVYPDHPLVYVSEAVLHAANCVFGLARGVSDIGPHGRLSRPGHGIRPSDSALTSQSAHFALRPSHSALYLLYIGPLRSDI